MTLGEWVQLIYSAPGTPPVVVGVLLLDHATNHLHVRCQPSWWARFEQDDVDLIHAFVADLEQQTVDGDIWLSWMEDVASHALRISQRQPVQIESVSATLDRLCALSVENTDPVRKDMRLWEILSQPLFRYWQEASSVVAAALMLLIMGPELGSNSVTALPDTSPKIAYTTESELPIVYPPPREIVFASSPIKGASPRRERKPAVPHHRNFQTPPAVVVQPRLEHVIQVGPAPSLATPFEPSIPSIMPATLSSVVPPYRSRNPLVKLAAAVIAPFRALGSNIQKSDHKNRLQD